MPAIRLSQRILQLAMSALDAAAPDVGMFLTGMSVALLGAGLLGDLARHDGGNEPGVVAILLSMALGLVLLRAAAMELWRLRGGLIGGEAQPRRPDPGVAGLAVQPSFAWMQVSLLAMFCGLVAAFSPLLTEWAVGVNGALETGFFWSTGSAFVRDTVITLAATLAPMTAIGAVVLCLQRLRPDGGWSAVALAYSCIGGGVAEMLVRPGSWLAAPHVLQRAGAVPALALSFLAVYASSRCQRRSLASTTISMPPALAPSRRPILHGAVMTVGLLAVLGALVATLAKLDAAVAASGEALPETTSHGNAVALMTFGCGALAHRRLRRMRESWKVSATWQAAIAAGVLVVLLFAANGADPAQAGILTVILGATGLVCGWSWAALLERRILRTPAPASAGLMYTVLSLVCLALVNLLLAA